MIPYINKLTICDETQDFVPGLFYCIPKYKEHLTDGDIENLTEEIKAHIKESTETLVAPAGKRVNIKSVKFRVDNFLYTNIDDLYKKGLNPFRTFGDEVVIWGQKIIPTQYLLNIGIDRIDELNIFMSTVPYILSEDDFLKDKLDTLVRKRAIKNYKYSGGYLSVKQTQDRHVGFDCGDRLKLQLEYNQIIKTYCEDVSEFERPDVDWVHVYNTMPPTNEINFVISYKSGLREVVIKSPVTQKMKEYVYKNDFTSITLQESRDVWDKLKEMEEDA